jgi:hypothetical protein
MRFATSKQPLENVKMQTTDWLESYHEALAALTSIDVPPGFPSVTGLSRSTRLANIAAPNWEDRAKTTVCDKSALFR